MREGALVLLCFPVEVEGTNGGEGRGDAVQDDEVDVVAEVDPDGDEQAEVGGYQGGIYVGEGLGGLICFGFPISNVHAQIVGRETGYRMETKGSKKKLTARKKSLISCVM